MLLSLSARYSLRGYSATEFNLSMSRGDIANYLGLAVETVSRLFARFQQDGLLAVEGRNLKILDFSKLKFMVDGCEPPAKLTENRGPN
jgi:CRP/FNR family transcriptional regulator